MPTPHDPLRSTAPRQGGSTLHGLVAQAGNVSTAKLASLALEDLRQRWACGDRIRPEDYFEQLPALGADADAVMDLIYAEILLREELGENVSVSEYLCRFPDHASALRRQFQLHGAVKSQLGGETPTNATRTVSRNAAAGKPKTASEQLRGRFGRYVIERTLGKGGMGTVYLAHDTQLDRPVALKVMRFAADESSQGRERFFREARTAATLDHPNICPVYDVGNEGGIPYLTMAYIEGRSLAEFTKDGQRLPVREVATLVRQLALGLAEAHQRGIVHRDIKPSNVMLNRRQEPILMDFGLARHSKTGDERLTQDGQVIGTPAYMPPEQVNGDLEAIGPASDIYSLGVMLYELLTGKIPFHGNIAQILAKVLNEEPPPASKYRLDLDPRLEAICAKAMAKNIAERHASMAEFAEALGRFLHQTQPTATVTARSTQAVTVSVAAVPSPSPLSHLSTLDLPAKPRRSLEWVWVPAAVVLGGGVLAAFTLFGGGAKDPPRTAPQAAAATKPATPAAVATKPAPPETKPTPPDTKPTVVVAADKDKLAKQARAILDKACYRCHGKDDSAEGGFRDALDVGRMIARKKLVPGNAAGSRVFKKIVSGEMPPENEKPQLTKAEIATLSQWIDAGAPAFDEPAVAQERPFRSTKDVLTAVRDHLAKLPSHDWPFQRYFTLTHLHNNKAYKDADLRLARAGLSKVINSLSWKPNIVLPEAIDPDQIVFAIDVRKLDWDRDNLWNEVLKTYPYGLKHDQDADPALKELAKEVYSRCGTDIPYVRGDWFLAWATRPPLYHTLLRLPHNAVELEKQLKVNIPDNFNKDKLVRAGFATSGVSGQNRMVERHESPYGAYWKSYDFKSNEKEGNLFRFPLGPEFHNNPFEKQAFKHDGGEVIFHLPNGLQAYLLVDGKDKRIDEGPIEVVSDSLKTSGTAKIVNGLSCLACHGQGMKADFKDTVRDGTGLQGGPRDKVHRLYPVPETMNKLLQEDTDRFLTAMDKACGPFLKVGDDKNKDIKDFPEPVGVLARQYILKELSLVDAALELGLEDATVLFSAVKTNDRLRELGLRPLATNATIKRETWESLARFISPYHEAASALELGTPKRVK